MGVSERGPWIKTFRKPESRSHSAAFRWCGVVDDLGFNDFRERRRAPVEDVEYSLFLVLFGEVGFVRQQRRFPCSRLPACSRRQVSRMHVGFGVSEVEPLHRKLRAWNSLTWSALAPLFIGPAWAAADEGEDEEAGGSRGSTARVAHLGELGSGGLTPLCRVSWGW